MEQLVVGDDEGRELVLDVLPPLQGVVDASAPGDATEEACTVHPTCLKVDGGGGDELPAQLPAQSEEAETRIGQRAAQPVLVGVEQRTAAFDVCARLPFVASPHLECQRLCGLEGVALGEGEACSRAYLPARLAGDVSLELSIIGFVKGGIDHDIEGVGVFTRHIVDAERGEDVCGCKAFLHEVAEALLVEVAFAEEHGAPDGSRL